MKEIVIISGKGGTGKTSLTASLAVLMGSRTVLADCDVDAADMHLLLAPEKTEGKEFVSGTAAEIDTDLCLECGRCLRACRFNAITAEPVFRVNALDCEGCGYCSRICPVGAITNVPQMVGLYYDSPVKTNTRMAHARLGIGAENSGKLVTQVKALAREIAEDLQKDRILIDGAPGVGCPVIASLSGAAFTVLVTEPSGSGFHDLKRVYELIKKFQIPAGCVINKTDINPAISKEIKNFLIDQGIRLLGELPYHENFSRSMTQGQTIVEWEAEKALSGTPEIFTPTLKKIAKEIENL